jgi:flagellar protein FliO/FliZ
MYRAVSSLSGLAAVIAAPALQAQAAAAPRPFAAPDVSTALPSSSVGGIGQVTFALLLVLVAVFVVAVLVKRLRAVTGGGAHGIEILAQTALGARERAVVIKVGETRLLLGVAPGQVRLLHTLPADAELVSATAATATRERPSFASLLKKSLGR